jgi:uncharacterized protein DUF4917
MLTFDEMWEEIPEGASVSVLLGNGFSRAWNDATFRYETLYDAATFGQRDNIIRKVFDVLETQDFEKVTGRLRSAADILTLYVGDDSLSHQLQEDTQAIKDALLRAIADTHPSRPNQVTEPEYRCARQFLSMFASIYTVNYDLLMYWARNQDNLPPEGWTTDDGFRRDQLWVGPDTDQEVFFLHGALHLYETQEGVKKHAFSNQGQPIIDTVQENLQRDIFPLFVSEPTADLKQRRINANPYLSYCLRRLTRESGFFFVFGHQFSEVDQHIFAALDNSRVERVFVSIFGDPNSPENRRTRANARAGSVSKLLLLCPKSVNQMHIC